MAVFFRNTFLLLAFGFLSVNAQPPSIQWQKCLGGTQSDDGQSIRLTSDSGFLIAGNALSNDGDVSGNHGINHWDYWVTKLDSGGFLQWQKCYGGTDEDRAFSIEIVNNDSYIIAGWAGSYDGDIVGMHGPSDYWILKCDQIGNIQWQNCLGGTYEEDANRIIQTNDLGYIVTGVARSIDFDVVGRHDSSACPSCGDVWLVKLDSAGVQEWTKCYGGYWHEVGYSIIQTIDSGYLLASSAGSDNGDVQGLHGAVAGFGNPDYWIVKIDAIGSIQWQKCFGGTENDTPSDLIQTLDGGYAVIGKTFSTDYDVIGSLASPNIPDAWIIKFDNIGNLQWQKCLGGSEVDIGRKILQTSDSSYFVLCHTQSIDGDLIGNPANGMDVWLVKLDHTGNIIWQECFGGSGTDECYDMQLTPDGGIVLVGLTTSNDGDVAGNHGLYDKWVVKLSPILDAIPEEGSKLYANFLASLIPSTSLLSVSFYTNDTEPVSLHLTDISGRNILNRQLFTSNGLNNNEVPVPDLASGIYFVSLFTESGVVTKKVIKN